jgi:hypothetical protein
VLTSTISKRGDFMTDQTGNQPNADNSESPNVAHWTEEHLPYVEDFQGLGFLQMCADRRFHRCIQEEFKKDAGLPEREDYWIHADAGGTPKMADQLITPNYCYETKGVRLMGWSAHGAGCGGFGAHVPDEVIQRDLCQTMQRKVQDYPEATHFIYFVTVVDDETVLWRMIVKPGGVIVCT